MLCILLKSYHQLCLFCMSLTPCQVLVIYLHFPYLSCILLCPPRFIATVFYLLIYPSLFGQWAGMMQDVGNTTERCEKYLCSSRRLL
jgi:hypothetical protein